jgi:1-phosphatidylinositol-4-phosphate 5-kinase
MFDLKGSEYDREVLLKKPNFDLAKITLKDIDF